jgi:hypothetical protein
LNFHLEESVAIKAINDGRFMGLVAHCAGNLTKVRLVRVTISEVFGG